MTSSANSSLTQPPAAVKSKGSPLLRVQGLGTEFRLKSGGVKAVNDVSFDIYPGDVLGIVGESGSGKSVTARSIMRMVRPPGEIYAGTVQFDGEDLLALPESEMRRRRGSKVAMVFQDPQAALNPVMKVGDQIVEAMTVHGVDKKTARARAVELLEQVGIPDIPTKIDQYPHQFSGGMRQRVVIAIALANDPALLIADEPTTALDVTIQAQILRLLSRLRTELGIAVAIITHDMGVVAELCTDVVVMYGGRTVEKGTVEQVFTHPRHPYTAALLDAMPRLDDDRDGRPLPAIPGAPPDPAALPAGCAFAPRCQFAEDACGQGTPELLQIGGTGQTAACFVAQRGVDVSPSHVVATVPAEDAAPAPQTPVPTAETVLEVRDLRIDVGSRRHGLFHQEPPVYAVDSVSLSVHAGRTLGLVGESGCGKSTLSRGIVGINPIAGGSVLVGGTDVSAMREEDLKRVRSSVQYVFQDPYASLNPRRTIRQSLSEALAFRGIGGQALETAARSLMEQVGLRPELLDRYPHAFSGGQRQRIGIARALAREPRTLVLDEPVSALDMSVQAQIINLLEELQNELGLGYLFIAHDLSVVRHLSDTVAVMYLGRIVEYGDVADVYGSPQHPYTAALLSSSPVASVAERERESIVLRGDLPSPANPPSGCRFRTRCPIGPLAHPDRTICAESDPQLTLTPTGQRAACHFAGELAGRP
ncbi:peptide/nickel transport system ATP-binding protein [Streptomyces sp. LBL]|uniref:ABC transporter ATP-binding protein n=1 Tax=Streptomyces sp. LBL TaxID=2940562 RepID=UPI002476DF6B|nr:ABC transporter ATP-binding protein [Streptomyces sp. LBL]MDH6626220.1 peptide/nickel transport system ATP-binding protein [Streptomyces sp. LBL]